MSELTRVQAPAKQSSTPVQTDLQQRCSTNMIEPATVVVPPIVHEALRSPGEPLDMKTRAFMEPRFGHDFSKVRVHSDAKAAEAARAVDARAFTVGRDVVFGEGQYTPGQTSSEQLLVHELTHVMQQEGFGALIQCASKTGGVSNVNEGMARNAASATVKMYQFTVEGKTLTLTEAEFNREKARESKRLELDFKLIEEEAIFDKQRHQEYLDKVHGWVGIVSDIFGGTEPPLVAIWSWPVPAINYGRITLESGNLEMAGRQLKLAQESLRNAQRKWNDYTDKTTGGAQKAITTLEYTRDISFAIAIGTAAVVAAPVVAGALAGGGAMTAGTTLATGAMLTAGGAETGAILRGGSSAVGQALAGGPVSSSEVWKETKEGAKRGAVDAASAIVGFGAGKALGLGAKGVSLGGKVVRGGLAGGASGGTGSALESTLEGKSAGEILEATGKGVLAGTVGGAMGSTASHISAGRSTLTRYVAEALGEAGGGAASAVVSGGSLEEIQKAAITSVIAGRATAAASHPIANVPKDIQSKQAPPFKPDASAKAPEPPSAPELVKEVASAKAPEPPNVPEPVKTAVPTKATEPPSVPEPVKAVASAKAPEPPSVPEPVKAVASTKAPEPPSAPQAHEKLPKVGGETEIITDLESLQTPSAELKAKIQEHGLDLPADEGPVQLETAAESISRMAPQFLGEPEKLPKATLTTKGKLRGFDTGRQGSNEAVATGTLEGLEPVAQKSVADPNKHTVTEEEQRAGLLSPEELESRRHKTPTRSFREQVQDELPVGSPDPAFQGHPPTEGPAQADHIHPIDKIRRMPGCAYLSEERVLQIFNDPRNIKAASPAENASRQHKYFEEWNGHQEKGWLVDEDYKAKWTAKEKELIPLLQDEVNRHLKEQMSEEWDRRNETVK